MQLAFRGPILCFVGLFFALGFGGIHLVATVILGSVPTLFVVGELFKVPHRAADATPYPKADCHLEFAKWSAPLARPRLSYQLVDQLPDFVVIGLVPHQCPVVFLLSWTDWRGCYAR